MKGATAVQTTHRSIKALERAPQGIIYESGNTTYFADSKHSRRVLHYSDQKEDDKLIPVTAIVANQTHITGELLEATIGSYLEGDDVISHGFLANIYLSSSFPHSSLDQTAIEYLANRAVDTVFIDSIIFDPVPSGFVSICDTSDRPLPSGPYTAIISDDSITLLTTYRLYIDSFRSFITGMYPSNDGVGTFFPLQSMSSRLWGPIIPVPSRIYSWADQRPLAGVRVAVKDLFDVRGLQTPVGSQAWVSITPIANATAPSIQRLVDFGAVLVGKYKLAQFASGADPWEWMDEHHPFNSRGDGYLTCSASSSGGGCSVAAYDWLDAAIGSDTGASMRLPAAVSGTYGNRPSQGMISFDGAVPLNRAQDTAGVFSRNPVAWARFAKTWYTQEMHQNSAVTGLSPLNVPDTMKFPSRVLYPDEHFPMKNPAAQVILDTFISKMSALFSLDVHHFNLTRMVDNASIYSNTTSPWESIMNASIMLGSWSQHVDVAGPLISEWEARYDGRFPPVEAQWRALWSQFNASLVTQEAYNKALVSKATAVDWFEKNVLYETPESCSESLLLCDIGTGGVPSFREKELNDGPNATYVTLTGQGALPCASICPMFGCADYTIPIGQVDYQSPITMVTEQLPVSVNMIARRGCDLMLFNMVEKMAEAGILQTVKTGRTAFEV
ncbi:amidase signature enzyme [Aspergillus steynii IBT 23096]|uniref:Amidase signature enzyme n=1 Tax=Aspergillus steynii IBT 23096 TaxID=1392250 RepID=A0A2I2GF12_9EURO|nr:amidase signature enzyme [Aspergillus steynii IBT 23096]PLB51479.1 amidase signature enzyme [Aspergillus steynii IBT 23096]